MNALEIFCAGVTANILPSYNGPNILVNAPNEGINERKIACANNMFRLAKAKYTFLDSGGYQIYKAERLNKVMTFNADQPLNISKKMINISPRHVIEVGRKLNPYMMTSLDFPIRTLSDKCEQEHEFMNKLGFNVKWATETSELWQKYRLTTRLLIPIQCYTIEHFDTFMYHIRNVQYGGLCMPVRNLSIKE